METKRYLTIEQLLTNIENKGLYIYDKKIVINASIYDDFDKKEVSEIIKNISNLYIKIEQNSEIIEKILETSSNEYFLQHNYLSRLGLF